MSPNEDQESQDSAKSTDINIDSESGNLSSSSFDNTKIVSESQPSSQEETAGEQSVTTETSVAEQPETQPESQAPLDTDVDKELSASEPEVDKQQASSVTTEPTPKKTSHVPKAAVIVAVIIGLLLIAISIMAYLKTQDEDNSQSTAEQSSQVAEKTTVKGTDVDTTIQDIEGEINKTNDAVDIPTEESVGDQSLGL